MLLLPSTPFGCLESPHLVLVGWLSAAFDKGVAKKPVRVLEKVSQTEEIARAKAGRVDRTLASAPTPLNVNHKLRRSKAAVPRAPEATEGLG